MSARAAIVGAGPSGFYAADQLLRAGVAVDVFEVRSDEPPEEAGLGADLTAALDVPVRSEPLPEARVHFDDRGSPWHTVCEIEAPDKPGLLHQLATAFAAADVTVVAATIGEHEADAVDTFELVTRSGEKLSEADRAAVRTAITGGAELARRRFGSGLVAR